MIRKAFASARSGAGRLIEVVGDSGVGKTRLLEALRDAAAGFRKLHATCEAYTSSMPYVVWRELLREMHRDSGATIPTTGSSSVSATRWRRSAPDLAPWLPLLAAAFDVEIAPRPRSRCWPTANRRAKLHETVARFVAGVVPGPAADRDRERAPHGRGVGRAPGVPDRRDRDASMAVCRGAPGVRHRVRGARSAETVVRIELKPLAPQDALRMAQLATAADVRLPAHVLEVVAKRSGGNPQFLRDLLRTAIESGGIADLPDSAEAAAMAQIDALAPEDRARGPPRAVFGLTFHPRMLAWFVDEAKPRAGASACGIGCGDLFDEEPDGYLRFRQTLLRDVGVPGAAVQAAAATARRVAAHLEEEMDYPEEAAGILSLHYFEAGEYRTDMAVRNCRGQARAKASMPYVEAAGLYARALEAGTQAHRSRRSRELAGVHEALGDAWYRAGEFAKASEAYTARAAAGRERSPGGRRPAAQALARRGEARQVRRGAALGRAGARRTPGTGGTRGCAADRTLRRLVRDACCRRRAGRPKRSTGPSRRAAEAEAADDAEALGDAYFVMGWAYGDRARQGGSPLTRSQRRR